MRSTPGTWYSRIPGGSHAAIRLGASRGRDRLWRSLCAPACAASQPAALVTQECIVPSHALVPYDRARPERRPAYARCLVPQRPLIAGRAARPRAQSRERRQARGTAAVRPATLSVIGRRRAMVGISGTGNVARGAVVRPFARALDRVEVPGAAQSRRFAPSSTRSGGPFSTASDANSSGLAS